MVTCLLNPHFFRGQPFLLNPHHIPHSLSSSFTSDSRHYLGWNNSRSTQRTGINFDDELYTDDDDDFGFSAARKRREWWYTGDSNAWFDDDDDDEEDEFWIFKVFRAFGWMLPAVGISLLLGTGPNALLMAIAVPLGQTALSLVFDKVFATTTRRPKPRRRTGTRTSTRTRKKPFVRPTVREETRDSKADSTVEEKGSPESWTAATGSSRKNSGKKGHPFGGWDELDEWPKVPRGTPKEMVDEMPKKQYKGKLSKTRRVGDTPMFVRLLIAVFPFLGSWTRFLF